MHFQHHTSSIPPPLQLSSSALEIHSTLTLPMVRTDMILGLRPRQKPFPVCARWWQWHPWTLSSTCVHCWRLYFLGALLVGGGTISNVGCHLNRPSLLWGFLYSKGVGWRYMASGCAPLVLPSTRREVNVSGDILVKMLSPTLSPHYVGKPSQFVVGGWP